MKNTHIAVIGLGYIGLPLALAFSKYFQVVGFDKNVERINQLRKNKDNTNEILASKIKKCKNIIFTSDEKKLVHINIFIIAVPTPVNKRKLPDLKILKSVTKLVAKYLKKNTFIIYESTVYPGATEEICIPILSKISKLIYNKDYFVGYSPERINPGDKKHNLKNVNKIVSGSNKFALNYIHKLYSKIIDVKVHKTPNIKTAESAKIIENIQRDVNIALINEFTQIFDKLNVSINDVLKAAETKWNFINFKPGLVGGHCISVDPYYLTYKSKKIGYKPNLILSGRKINNLMPKYIFNKLLTQAKNQNINIKRTNVLIMGGAFKENCSDFRNNQSVKLRDFFIKNGAKADIYDPLLDQLKFKKTYKFNLIKSIKINKYDIIAIMVSHKKFVDMGIKNIIKYSKENNIIFDFKNIFKDEKNTFRL